MPADGIYLSNDSYNDLSSQLFAQDARGVVADRWAQDAHDVAPDLIRQAQEAENQRQAEQQRQAEAQQREADAASFPAMAAAALPDMVKSAGGDPSLMAHLGGATSPSDAGSMTDALPNSPATSPSPAPDVSAPAPALPAPSDPITTPLAAPAPAPVTSPSAPITAPMAPPPTSPNQPVTFSPATQTTAGLSGGGDLSGRIGARGQQIMSQAAQDASWLGDQGVKALQSVLLTEGGLAGARGDNGMSAGPLQFYEKGQLANFAQQFGLSLDQAKQYVEAHPEEAVRWAIGSPDRPGYLGAAIQAGQKAGLQGPDLATYAQAHGQVSVSPERAGANFNALFGSGQNPIAGAAQAVASAVRDPKSILDQVAPFLGQSYVWGGKSPTTGFDCSGLAGYLTTGQPESTTTLYGKSSSVTADQAQPGDLVFWNMGSSDPHLQHVGVYLGNGQIVQSGGDQAKVNIGSVNQQIGSPPEFRRVGPGGAPAQAVAAPANAPDPSTPPSQQQSSNPIDTFKQKLGDAFSDLLAPLQNLFGGVSQTANTLGQQYAQGKQQLNQAGLDISANPLESFAGAGLGAPTQGEQLTAERNAAIASNNPVRDVPFAGGLSTIAAQTAADPTNLLLMGGGAAKALSTPAVQDALLAAMRSAQPAEARIGAASGADALEALLARFRTYPPDVQQGMEGFVSSKIQAGVEPAAVGDTVRQWMEANPAPSTVVADLPKYDQYGVAVDQPVLPEFKGATPSQAVPAQAAAEVPSLGLTNGARPSGFALEPEIAATLPPGSGPLAPPLPEQPAVDLVQGLLNKAKAEGRGDPSVHEALQSAIDQQNVVTRPTDTAPPTTNGVPSLGLNGHGPTQPPAGPPAPPTQPPSGPPVAPTAIPPSPPTGIDPWTVLRTLRVGSLAGGVQTMAHIVLNAPLQTAFKLLSDAPLTLTEPATIPLEFMGAWQGLRGWATHAASTGIGMGEPGQLAQQIGGRTGQAVETGLLGLVKTHPAIQDIARQIGSNMELWRQAGVEASRAGLQRWSGEWWAEVNRLVADPTPAIQADVQRIGDNFALRGAKGEAGQAISDLMTSRFGQKWGRMVNLFFDVGYHVAAQGVESSPIGLLGTGIDSAAMLINKGPYANGAVARGVTPLAERLRNNLVGTGLAIEAYHQAAQGNVTGNGPDDPKLKAELMDQGWQPDSFRVGGRYFPLHTLGRVGWALGEAANLYESTHTGDQGGYAKPGATLGDQFVNYAQRMGQYGENETFLRDVGQILQIAGNARDFSRFGQQETASLLSSLIPQGSLINNVATAIDPFTRKVQTGNLQQALQNRIPSGLGLPGRQDLPPRVTATGTQVQNPSQGMNIFMPRSTIAAPDPILTMLGQAGMGSPTIPKTIPVTSKYAVDLTPDEQYQYQVLHGQAVQQILADLPKDRDFASAPLATRQHILQQAMSKASEVARKQLLAQIPNSDLESRVIPNTLRTEQNTVTAGGF